MKNKQKNIDWYSFMVVFFILVKLALHFSTNTNYELLRDEMLFLNMGEHLSAGYSTVPPLTGLFAFLILKIFGFSVFGVRFFPALMGALSVYVISSVVREFGGGLLALALAASAYIFAPGFLLVDTLFTPNAFEELTWLLITWSIFRMVKRRDPRYWLLTGILVAIAFLNKYSVLFLVAGFVPALLFYNRSLLTSVYLYISVFIGLIIITPNIIWQYQHGWPVMIHMSELKSSQLDFSSYLDFPTSLYAFSQGSSVIWLTGLIFLLFSGREKEYRYIGLASLVIFMLLFLMKGKGYYALGLVPFLIAFGGYVIEKYFRPSLIYVILSVSLVASVAAIPSGLPVLSFENYSNYVNKTRNFILHPLLKWDDGVRHDFSQAYSDMNGWEKLSSLVAAAYYSLDEQEKRGCTIYGERNYGYAGAVYFYGRKHSLPEAITFHDSYVFWAPDSIPEGPMIYIYRDINKLDELFNDIRLVGSVDDKFFREARLKVFLCKSPKADIRQIYKDLARREKSRFSRK
jgi:uncharacterized membrane protein